MATVTLKGAIRAILKTMTNPQNQTTAINTAVFESVCAMGDAARNAQSQLAQANTEAKNELLNAIADALDHHADDIAGANALDMDQPLKTAWTLENLTGSNSTCLASPPPHKAYATWPPRRPRRRIVRGYHLENGLRLQQVRVPIGVLGMIYEARPQRHRRRGIALHQIR